MPFVHATPTAMGASAADLASIGDSLTAAHAAAAGPTTGLLAAANDEISTAIAALFSGQARQYQALGAKAALFHQQFMGLLNGGAAQYASTEASNANPLQTIEQGLINAINARAVALTGHPLIGNGTNGAPGAGQNGAPNASSGNGSAGASGAAGRNGLSGANAAASSGAGGVGGAGGHSAAAATPATGSSQNSPTTSANTTSAQNPVTATVTVDSGPGAMVATPNGRYVYVANYNAGSVSVIDTSTNTVIADPSVGIYPSQLVMAPDGSRVYVAGIVYTAGQGGTGGTGGTGVSGGPGAPPGSPVPPVQSTAIVAIDTATNSVGQAAVISGDSGGTPFMAITPDGSRIYIMNQGNNSVSVLNTSTNTYSANPISLPGSPSDLAITPDGKSVYVTDQAVGGSPGAVSVINTATNTVTTTIPDIFNNSSPTALTISSDGSRVYVDNWGASNSITTIDTATNTIIGSPGAISDDFYGFNISPDGHYLYVPQPDNQTISVFNTTTNSVVGDPIPVGNFGPNPGTPLTISPDGHYLYVPGHDEITVVNLTNNTVSNPIPVNGFGPSYGVVTSNGLAYISLYPDSGGALDPGVVSVINPTLVFPGGGGGGGVTGGVGTPGPAPTWWQADVSNVFTSIRVDLSGLSSNVHEGASHALQQIQHPAIQHHADQGVGHVIQQINHPSKLQVEIGGLLGDYASTTKHLHLTGGALGAALTISGDLQDLYKIVPGIANGNLGDYLRGLGDVAGITTSVAGLVWGATEAATLIIATDALITVLQGSFGL